VVLRIPSHVHLIFIIWIIIGHSESIDHGIPECVIEEVRFLRFGTLSKNIIFIP
jgi:hypothetical protein